MPVRHFGYRIKKLQHSRYKSETAISKKQVVILIRHRDPDVVFIQSKLPFNKNIVCSRLNVEDILMTTC
jgi:hypothetical protein